MQADKITKLMQDAAQDAVSYIAAEPSDKEFPFSSVCYYKITQDGTISVSDYVQQAAANAMQ